MAFIYTQKVVCDADGVIVSGSASLCESIYDSNCTSGHSKRVCIEKLGKVLYLSPDKKSGIFLSPTRGLVEYDTATGEFAEVSGRDPRISKTNAFFEPEVHTVFGDTYLLLNFLKKSGLLDVLRDVFQKNEQYERVLAHILHGILKDGSRITCDNFIAKSFASYVLPDIPAQSLKSDTRFFSMMGSDHVRVSFFKTFVESMRKIYPEFGNACYVDSTPLPNEIEDNPFNALCCHGVSAMGIMTRLVLVLDDVTGLPVWYDIIPGNILDINTIMNTVEDVAATLGIEIESFVLDAGYVSRELIKTFHNGTKKTIIGRMPARKGFPYKELYWKVKDLIPKGKYAFRRNNHTYFGCRKEITLFDQSIYAYVYVDQHNALNRFNDYLMKNEDDFNEMLARDKDWTTVKFGFFVLLSNLEMEPKDLLSEYFGRTEIETVFKTSKEYLDLLPLSKWSDETVRGKILHDIINTIVLLMMRKELKQTGYSTTEVFGKCQSLMCIRSNDNLVTVETPNKQTKEYYKLFKIGVPANLKTNAFMSSTVGLKM